jgi:hypothetical protein
MTHPPLDFQILKQRPTAQGEHCGNSERMNATSIVYRRVGDDRQFRADEVLAKYDERTQIGRIVVGK